MWVHKFVPEEHKKVTGFDHPKCTAVTFASPGLLLYAAQLQKDAKERYRPVNKDFMKAPENNKRRRTYLEVSFGKEDVPAISTNGKKTKQNKKRNEEETTQATEENKGNEEHRHSKQDEKYKEILRKSEEQFTKTLEETNASFGKRLSQVQESIKKNIEALQATNKVTQAAHKLEMEILRSAMVEFQDIQRIQNSVISEQLKQLLNQSGGNTEQRATRVEEVRTGKEKRAKTGDPISTDATHPALEARLGTNPGGIVHPGGRVPPHLCGMQSNSLAASMAASRMYQAYGGNAYPPPTMTPLQQQQQR
eukprot:scaffold135755_cov27-Attheya_sp.AAC.1